MLATSTGSGKSLAFWLPSLTAVRADAAAGLLDPGRIETVTRRGSVLYLCPTKALAADQLVGVDRLLTAAHARDIRVATCDGDTSFAERCWAQEHADVVLTNPDFLHFALLPNHRRWARLLGSLQYVVVDECHAFRGVFGAHVAAVLRRLQRLAVTMPGLYDLLPFYRCVDEGTTARGFGAADVAGIGGDAELAAESIARHEDLMSGPTDSLRLLVGTDQPTMQSMSISAGVLTPLYETCHGDHQGRVTGRDNRKGDSTVFRMAAGAFGLSPGTLPQSHGGLAKSEEAVAHVRDVLTNDTAGPPLGVGGIGVDVPDVISVDAALTVMVTGAVVAGTSCRIVEAFTNRQVARPPLLLRGGETTASVELPGPGVYRVEVKGGGTSAVTQQVMALPPGVQMSEVD